MGSEARQGGHFGRPGFPPRAPLKISAETLIEIVEPAAPGRGALEIRPRLAGVDVTSWAAEHRALLEEKLCAYGAIRLCRFQVSSAADFERLCRAASPELMDYGERSSPRSHIEGRVFTSTDHPPDQPIQLHNEQSYTLAWPMKIWFCCLRPPARGGRTPFADVRRVLARIPPEIRARFERDGVMYVRSYGNGLGLPWEVAFQTQEPAAVEAHCRASGIAFEWLGEGRLRTRQVRPAVRRHPRTGEAVWFNHAAFFHEASLEPATRAALRAVVGEDELSTGARYGDGETIPDEVIAALLDAYRAEASSFEWEAGDVLLLDNMLMAHGREPFEGPRRVAVVMSEPCRAGVVEAP